MKFSQLISAFSLLAVAATVTVGSMYVTVRAAAQQEAQLSPVAEANNELAAEIKDAMSKPLPPDEILHSRSHDIVLDADGAFNGQLSAFSKGTEAVPAAGLVVKVIRDGVVQRETVTDASGSFSVKNLEPGVSAILAFDKSSFLLYGVRLLAADADHPATQTVDLESTVVLAADLDLVNQLISKELTQGDVRFTKEPVAEEQQFRFGIGEAATSIRGHRVQLQKDGSLKGMVNLMDDRTGRLREVLDLTVYFLQNGDIATDTIVERNGAFKADGLRPGVYSLVGVGEDGTFAMSVEVLGPEYEPAAGVSLSGYRPVAVAAELVFSVAPANAANFNRSNANSLTNQPGSSSSPPAVAGTTPPGAGTGGGGTGGGAGGGGGGLGAALGAAALGGAAFLAGQESNDTPASPGN
jgi:hypothetical protein